MKSKKKLGEINLVTFIERYERVYPYFYTRVIDHYLLWEFTLESLDTLSYLCSDFLNYHRFIIDGEENDFIDKETIRNRIEKMSPEKKRYTKMFGLDNLNKNHIEILSQAIYHLSGEKRRLERSSKNKRLFSLELDDFKDDLTPCEKEGSSLFDDLTDEEYKKIEDFEYYSMFCWE